MKRMKQILALSGIIIIIALYAVTLVLSFSRAPGADRWLMASLYATFAVPLFIYIVLWLHKLLNKKDED